jgi:hypothetical protein
MQRAEQADLLLFGEQQEQVGCFQAFCACLQLIFAGEGLPSNHLWLVMQVKLIPDLAEADKPFHYEGTVETLKVAEGADLDCVAVFDGHEWTLQRLTGHLLCK